MAKADKTRQSEELSIEQLNAIDLLVQGKTDLEVGEAVGVARQTVCQWRNKNAEFIAELNYKRQEIWGASEQRLISLVSQAVDALADDLQSEDTNARRAAAIHVLKACGMYGQNLMPVGSISASQIKHDLRWDFDLYGL